MAYFENVSFPGDLQRGWPVGRNQTATGLSGVLSTQIDVSQIPKEVIFWIVVLLWALVPRGQVMVWSIPRLALKGFLPAGEWGG